MNTEICGLCDVMCVTTWFLGLNVESRYLNPSKTSRRPSAQRIVTPTLHFKPTHRLPPANPRTYARETERNNAASPTLTRRPRKRTHHYNNLTTPERIPQIQIQQTKTKINPTHPAHPHLPPHPAHNPTPNPNILHLPLKSHNLIRSNPRLPTPHLRTHKLPGSHGRRDTS
jgi:hypothetical protein